MRTLPQRLIVGCIAAVMIILCGCSDPEWLVNIHKGFERTRRECQPSDVRTSVMPLFEKYGRAAEFTEIPPSEVPKAVYSLPLFLDASTNEIMGFVSHEDELMFMTGSGFGHWGIVVCKDASSRVPKGADDHRTKPWGDGVLFYSEYK